VTQANTGDTAIFWSPDSKWIAWAQDETDSMDKVHLYSLDQNKSWEMTDGWYNSGQPAFSSDGISFLLSARDFNPIYSAPNGTTLIRTCRASDSSRWPGRSQSIQAEAG
jgi:tricorn protease